MSIKVMSKVWDNTTQKSNKLLMLLALADSANDAGYTYPSINTLAKKVRVNRRNAQKIIDALESEGEVVVFNRVNEHETQLHASNLYHLPKYAVEKGNPPDLKGEFRQRVVSPETLGGSVARDTRVVSPETPDPSIETSGKEKDSASGKESDAGNGSSSSGVQEVRQHDKPETLKPKRPKNPAEDWHHALAREFKLDPEKLLKGKTADTPYWKVANELKALGILPERIPALHRYIKNRAQSEGWKSYTVIALAKYALDFLHSEEKKASDFSNIKPKDWGAHEHTWYLDEGSQA